MPMDRRAVLGLVITGFLSACGGGSSGSRSRAARYDGGLVSGVQSNLSALGYEPGPIDGLFGPLTSGAIREYQIDHGLPPDGQVSRRLAGHIEERLRVATE